MKSKNIRKSLIITLSIFFGIILIAAAFFGIYYLIADSLIFDYINVRAEVSFLASPYDKSGEKEIMFPFFGNPLTISEESSTSIGFPLGAGKKNISVYDAVNEPIYTWVQYMKWRYDNNTVIDYTVEMDKEHITVNFSGTLTQDGRVTPIKQEFAFSIADASTENLPVWLNDEEISEGFKEYWIYLYEDSTKVPNWLEEKLSS